MSPEHMDLEDDSDLDDDDVADSDNSSYCNMWPMKDLGETTYFLNNRGQISAKKELVERTATWFDGKGNIMSIADDGECIKLFSQRPSDQQTTTP